MTAFWNSRAMTPVRLISIVLMLMGFVIFCATVVPTFLIVWYFIPNLVKMMFKR